MLSPLELVKKAKQQIDECSVDAVKQAIQNNYLIIDVREPNEFDQAQIDSAINIPRGILEFSIMAVPQIKNLADTSNISEIPIYLYCQSGGRSALAAQSLQSLGFNNVYSLAGGIKVWLSQVSSEIE